MLSPFKPVKCECGVCDELTHLILQLMSSISLSLGLLSTCIPLLLCLVISCNEGDHQTSGCHGGTLVSLHSAVTQEV